MWVLSLLLPFLSVSLVASRSLLAFGGDQTRLEGSFSVPGENPLTVRLFSSRQQG